MKKIQLITALLALLLCNACIKDLDTLPLNENDFTSEAAYSTPESYKQGMAKIYGGFVLVGQGDAGSAEIAVNDAGQSELNRAWWNLQEITADAAKVSSNWNDPWAREINTNTWGTVANSNIYAIFARTMLAASLVNEYLRQTADEKLSERGVDATLQAEIHKYRAEARLIRAYVYWMGMDVFGNMPFVTEDDPVGAFFPPEKKRADLFAWIEGELKALIDGNDLAAARANLYPRVDKGVAWGLLARMYLNAEVYTGAARWSDAKTAAANVIGFGYELAGEYSHLFMADNGDRADIRKEFIFAVEYDQTHTQSYGGTTAIVNGAMGPDKTVTGSDAWNGFRTSWFYAQKFGVSNPDYTAGTFTCNDKRAMFYIKGQKQEMDDIGELGQGWLSVKFSKLSSDGAINAGNVGNFASTDMPMMRLAEVYLIYAEATLRAAGGTGSSDATAMGYLKDLRTRAGLDNGNFTGYDLQYIIDERARELMWEGHRRTDLIRFGLYTSSSYLWPWKGGVQQGVGLDARYNLCPYPVDEVRLNKNLTPTPGYTY
jgi:hypothetical protein